MATRFYTDPTNAPDVSPGYANWWLETANSLRRKLVIDTPGNNGNVANDAAEGVTESPVGSCIWQFVSEPLDSISAAFAVSKAVLRCGEMDAKANAYLHIIFRKCDGDGGNDVDIASLTDDTEFNNEIPLADLESRFVGSSNLADGSFSQGDRLIVEVGFSATNTKNTRYAIHIAATDNHATTDLSENDTETAAYNSWIETGDTFTEATGGGPWSINVSDGLTAAQGLD